MKSRTKNEQGVSIILGCVLIFILVGVAAMSVGLGVVTSSKSRMQNIGNLVALGVLETVVRNAGNGGAVVRAEQIAQANALPGMGQLGTFGEAPNAGTSGEIDYGNWFFADPDQAGPQDPCSGNYPCYISAGGYGPNINSVRVTVNNQTNNKIVAPFAGLMGYGGAQELVSATAVLAGQCNVLLMDSSLSMTFQTHPFHPTLNPTGAMAIHPAPGGTSAYLGSFGNMPPTRSAGIVNPTAHFQSDYAIRNSNVGQQLVDIFVDTSTPSNYGGPEPMRTLNLGVNAALRALYEGSSGSLWRGIGFENGLLPAAISTGRWVPQSGFAPNPGALVQATNLDNRGTIDVNLNPVSLGLNPNFLDFGWFPRLWNVAPQSERTNIIEAFDAAIAALQNQTLTGSCPPFFKKNIILATDGVGNCWKIGTDAYQCNDSFGGYVNYRNQLLGLISQELQRKNISVTVLYSGSHVGPHFKNIDYTTIPNGTVPNDGTDYYSLEEALANGFGAFNEPDPNKKLFDERPVVDAGFLAWCAINCPSINCGNPSLQCLNRYAYDNMGDAGVEFRQPLSVLAQLAMDTNGVICPLLPLHPLSFTDPNVYIDHDGDSSTPEVLDEIYRTGQFQSYAITQEDPALQAVACANKTWKNKFFLTADDPA